MPGKKVPVKGLRKDPKNVRKAALVPVDGFHRRVAYAIATLESAGDTLTYKEACHLALASLKGETTEIRYIGRKRISSTFAKVGKRLT